MARRTTGSLCFASLLTIAASLTTGCGEEDPELDPALIGDIEAPISSTCSFDAKLKTLSITVEGGEVLVLSRRKDGVLLADGQLCGTATASTAKSILIVESAGWPGDQQILLDFTTGRFGAGTITGPGIQLRLGGGNDSLTIQMGDLADKIAMGAAGIALDGDKYVDLKVSSSGSVSYSVVLGKGNDTFTAQGATTVDTPLLSPVVVIGGDGNDKLTGGSGDDELFGGAGNDWLKGGLGDDLCAGDAGDDVFDESRPVSGTNGNDTYTDSAGTKDKLDYSTRTSPLAIDIEPAEGGTDDDGELELNEADQVDPGIDILLGGSASDTLSGDSGANTVFGGLGDDVLAGGDGNDILNGDAGNDRFDEGNAANGADIFKGGVGIDTVDYGLRIENLLITMDGRIGDGERVANESDTVSTDIENCVGGAGADDITGNTLDNVLAGGGGADILRGLAGRDRFDEGDSANGGDTFVGGVGFDTVDYSARSQSLLVALEGAVADDGEDNEHDLISIDIESCQGGSGSDTLVGSTRADELNGGDGDDTLRGGAGNDTLSGDGGDDTLEGGAGDDTLDGGDHFSGDTLDCRLGSDISLNGETTVECEI